MTTGLNSKTTHGFSFERRVSYYDTDAMGIVHHSNHVRYFEDARVAWMRESGLANYHAPKGPYTFAVHELSLNYKKPLRFDDLFKVSLTVRLDGLRLRFDYVITLGGDVIADVIADGHTVLIPLDVNFRPSRLPPSARDLF